MIYKFPYTDLYSLNLDWMIQAMKEMQAIVEPLDRVVNSVNNMTGDVVITKAFLLNILESMVSKFNGRAGDVTLTAADVNNTMIDITWTSDPGDVIGDIQQNVLDQMYTAGKRVLIFLNNLSIPDTIYFLTLVGDVVTPQIYSPTAALAGVASFNGQTGAVTATGSDLQTADDDDTPIDESISDLQTAVSHQSQQIDSLQAAAAYVEDGDNATQKTYSEGEFILWKGSLYTVNSGGIPLGTAITGHVTAVTSGGLNAVNNKVSNLDNKVSNLEKNNIGSSVDLSGYTYESRYTAPSDGYVVTFIPYDASSGASLQGTIMSASNYNFITIYMTNDGTNKSQMTFVKKGMSMYGTIIGTGCSVRYYPIE